MTKKVSYRKYLRNSNLVKPFTKDGFYDPNIIPHGWKRYQTGNQKTGFSNLKTTAPGYWFRALSDRLY